MDSYDVVVIGAGLAGLYCTSLLSQHGLHVLLVDRKPSLTTAIHTTGIFVRRTLEDFALPEQCLGPGVREVRLYSPRLHPLVLESRHDEFRVGQMGKLYTYYLNTCLKAGISWTPASHYRGWDAGEQNTSIIMLETHGTRWTVRTRYLIGADGATSQVAHDLGLSRNTTWITGVEDVFHDMRLAGSPCFHCFLDADLAPGYLAWIIHDGQELHLGVGGYPNQFHPLHALERFLTNPIARTLLVHARADERRGGRIPVGGVLPYLVNERALLVGDAAGAVSPLTAGGLDPCLRLSWLAATVVANYLATGDTNALKSYNGKRFRAHFRTRLWLRSILAHMRNQEVLEAGCTLLRLPPFRSLASHIFFGNGSFPDTPLRH